MFTQAGPKHESRSYFENGGFPTELSKSPWNLTLFCCIQGQHKSYVTITSVVELRWLQISYNPVRTSNHFAQTFLLSRMCYGVHTCPCECTVVLTVDFTGYPQAHKDGHGHEEGACKKGYCTCEDLGVFLITKCSHYIFLLISPQALSFLVWCCFLKSPCHYKCVHTDMWNFINYILLSPAGGVGLGMI